MNSKDPELLEESPQKERIPADGMPQNQFRLLGRERFPVFRQMVADESLAVRALQRGNAQFAPSHFRQHSVSNLAIKAGGDESNSAR